jgi:hypothetical protein
MKLNFLPLFAAVLFTTIAPAQADTIEVIFPSIRPRAVKTVDANFDSISYTVPGKPFHKNHYWFPGKKQYDQLVRNIEKICNFEKSLPIYTPEEKDNISLSKKSFLIQLASANEMPIRFFRGMENSQEQFGNYRDPQHDRDLYNKLPELIRCSDDGDLFLLQYYLVKDCYGKIHPGHNNDAKFVQIWSKEKVEAFYAAKYPAEPKKSTALNSKDENSFANAFQ